MNGSHIDFIGRSTLMQLFRYAFVGAISNVAAYLSYLLFTHLGLTPKIAMTLLYCVGAASSFFGNRSLTFSYTGGALGSGARYFLSHLMGYLINIIILVVFVDELGYAHQLVQAAAIFIVAAFLFVALKFFVFKVSS